MGYEDIINGIIGASGTAVQTLLVMAIGGALIFYLIRTMSYKHQAILREVTKNGRSIVHNTKWKFAKDKDGVEGIKFQKVGGWAEITTSDAIEVTGKGKKFVEAEIYPSGQVRFISFQSQGEEKTGKFQELTTTQRQILVNQTVSAAKRKRKKLFDTIEKIAPMIALTIIAISLMMMYADMGKPLLDMGDKINANQQIQLEQLQIIQELTQDVQVIKDEIRPDIAAQERAEANAPS